MLQRNVIASNHDIYILTETWLSKEDPTARCFPPEFVVQRQDREQTKINASKGGGTLIAIHEKFNNERILLNDPTGLMEYVATETIINNKRLVIYNAYIRPISSDKFYENKRQEIYDSHLNNIKFLTETYGQTIMVTGDFNLPNVEWNFDDDGLGLLPNFDSLNCNKKLTINFLNSMLAMGFSQLNHFTGFAGNVLDLIFTNYSDGFEVIPSEKPIVNADRHHPPLEIILLVNKNSTKSKETYTDEYEFCYKKADFEQLKEFYDNANFDSMLNANSCDDMLNIFYDIMETGIDKFVPKIKVKHTNRPRYFSKELTHLKNMKNKAHKEWKMSGDKRRYNAIRSIFDPLNQHLQREYIEKVANSVKSNASAFWNYIKDNKASSSIPNKLSLDEENAENPAEVTELFAKHFERTYVKSSNDFDIEKYLDSIENTENMPQVSVIQIREIIKSIKNSSGKGEDIIHPLIIKKCAEELAIPLTNLFNKIIKYGKFPDRWKIQYIIPVHKSGSRFDATKYRPIAIPPTLAKLFDHILSLIITPIIDEQIIENQHGFTKGKSTITNLMHTTSMALDAIANQNQLDIVYADMSRAFDVVPHHILIQKLSKFGLSKALLRLIWSFLTNRTQYVKCGKYKSKPFVVPSGVFQGSHCSPKFFIAFINDLTKVIKHVTILIFADDVKLLKEIIDINDTLKIQEDLNSLETYCKKNGLILNQQKCIVMSIHRKRNPIINDYRINNFTLNRVNKQKDLGIWFDEKLNFDVHIEKTKSTCSALIGLIIKMDKKRMKPETIILLYNALVRSIIEYGRIIWDRHLITVTQSIESIQKQIVLYALRDTEKRDCDYRLTKYDIRCKKLNLQSLERRRANNEIFYVHDIITERINAPFLINRLSFNQVQYGLRRNRPLAVTGKITNNIQFRDPLRRAVDAFNNIFEHINHLLNSNIFIDRTRFRNVILCCNDEHVLRDNQL